MTQQPLADVALAISAFNSDESVIARLETAFAHAEMRFGAVIVVDSLGSGAIQRSIDANKWAVQYVDADRNLGSAGNLDLRLQLAAATGLEWCFCLNHDGELDPDKVLRLVECGINAARIGAVYPRLRLTLAGGRLDAPRRRLVPRAAARHALPSEDLDVAWGSSNGALYRLEAVRNGLRTWSELWLGYEDLAIGWELATAGWRQLLCGSVEVADNYEYRRMRLLGRTFEIVEKPAWYSYYQLRNLALIRRGTKGKAISLASLGWRAVLDIGIILLWKRQKSKRLRLLLSGLADGLKGCAGKGPVP